MTLEALTPKKFTETDYDTAHTRETLHSSSTSLGGLALEHAGNEQIHEKKEINNRAYPRDYFTAQILFAKNGAILQVSLYLTRFRRKLPSPEPSGATQWTNILQKNKRTHSHS